MASGCTVNSRAWEDIIPKWEYLLLFLPGLRPRRYQSVATFVFPSRLTPSELLVPKCHCYHHLSVSARDLRPRSYHSVVTFEFLSHVASLKLPKCFCSVLSSIRLAHSKLPKCRYFRVPFPSYSLQVTKVSLLSSFSGLSPELAPSKSAKMVLEGFVT